MPRRKDERGTISTQLAAKLDSQRGTQQWLDPISMSRLQAAVKDRKRTIVINGIRYSISYGHFINYPASGERAESVKLRREDGEFAPFGYVSMKRIENFDFEKGE